MNNTSKNSVSRLLRALALFALVAGTIATMSSESQAGFVTFNNFAGHTQQQTVGTSTGRMTLEFAVLDKLGGTPGDTYGTGYANFDTSFTGVGSVGALNTSGRYLYLYQDVVDPTSAGSAVQQLIKRQATTNPLPNMVTEVLSYKQWNLMFSDDLGPISTTNQFGSLGNNWLPSVPSGNVAPHWGGVSSPSIVGPGANSLVGITSFGLTTGSLAANFSIAPGRISRLYGFTSDRAPTWSQTNPSTTSYAGGTYPTVPEPSSEILMALGAVAIVAYRFRLKLQKKAALAA